MKGVALGLGSYLRSAVQSREIFFQVFMSKLRKENLLISTSSQPTQLLSALLFFLLRLLAACIVQVRDDESRDMFIYLSIYLFIYLFTHRINHLAI